MAIRISKAKEVKAKILDKVGTSKDKEPITNTMLKLSKRGQFTRKMIEDGAMNIIEKKLGGFTNAQRVKVRNSVHNSVYRYTAKLEGVGALTKVGSVGRTDWFELETDVVMSWSSNHELEKSGMSMLARFVLAFVLAGLGTVFGTVFGAVIEGYINKHF